MKKFILTAAGVTTFVTVSAFGQINVSGTAEVKVAPDQVCISAGVEARDAHLEEATRQNDERVGNALAFLKEAGIPDKDIQTDTVEVQPRYGPGDTKIEPEFYAVRKSIQVKLNTTTDLAKVVTGLLGHGVNNLYGVDFRTSELRKYRDQARTMAIRAAKEKANALCAELDVKCGKPISVSTSDYGGYYSWSGGPWGWRNNAAYMNSVQNVVQNNYDAGGTAESTMSIGQISVSATVNASFSIQ